MHEGHAEQILAHIEKHLEPVGQVLRDAADATTPVDIAHVPASELRPIHTLITVGMSRVAMPVPRDVEGPARIELMMVLPQSWKLDEASLRDEQWRWPLTHLRRIARASIDSSRWIGWGQVLANGEPPQPLVTGTRFCGFVIVPSLHVPPSFYQLRSRMGDVVFFSAVPLYAEEMQLAHEQGTTTLFEKMLDRDVRDLVDMKRRNVAKKRFGWF
jgi:hypothetical protein